MIQTFRQHIHGAHLGTVPSARSASPSEAGDHGPTDSEAEDILGSKASSGAELRLARVEASSLGAVSAIQGKVLMDTSMLHEQHVSASMPAIRA